MAIYFGNLDRELADRQNVLKEDAARQYRGYRDIQQSFGSLGDTVSSSIKDVAQAKLDQAKLQYNISRNEEADKIRAEQHSQATQRNRELSLDSTLKNIERFRKSSIENYIGKLWNWRDPKAVHASYAERMKIFSADKDTLDPDERIQMYPNLFGTKAVKKLEYYKTLLSNKKDGVVTSDADIQAALNALPLTPLNFMDWAIDTKRYNEKVKGINPTKIPNAMQRAALIEYGYDIPDPEDLFKKASATTAGLTDPPPKPNEGTVKEALEIDDLTSKPGAEKEAEQKVENLGIDSGVGGLYIDDTTGDVLSLGGGGVVSDSSTVTTDGETIAKLGQGHWEKGVWVSATGDVMSLEGDETGKQKHKSNQNNSPGYPGRKTLDGQELSQEAQNAIEQITTVEEDALRYQKHHRKMKESPGYPGRANSFKVAAEIVGPSVTDTITGSLYGSDRIQEAADRMNQEGKPISAEGKKKMESIDPGFFPFMEAKRGRDMGAKYSKLPNYSTWENVSKEEKKAILEHPATVAFGASPKSVANLIKAKDALSDKNHEILTLHNSLKHYSVLKDPGSNFRKLVVPTSKYRGMAGTDVELVNKVKRYNTTMPLLTEERKKLLAKFNEANRSVDASKTRNLDTGATYLGERPASSSIRPSSALAFPFGEAKDYGIRKATIKPKPIVDTTSGMALAPGSTATEQLYVDPKAVEIDQDTEMIDAEEEQKIYKTAVKTIIDKEGYGTKGEGHMYFDGENPTKSGDYNAEGSQNLVLAGGNNIYDTINSITNKDKRDAELEKVAYGLFGEGKRSGTSLAARLGFGRTNKDEFLHYMNMDKKDHRAYYNTHEQRGAVKLSRLQRNYLTDYSMNNHLERLIEKHPYLNNIARYPKEMQLFIMDNAFNMGPNWLGKFTKLEKHLKKWVEDGYKKSDLKLVMKEYKDSDHFKKKISKARALENYERLESILG